MRRGVHILAMITWMSMNLVEDCLKSLQVNLSYLRFSKSAGSSSIILVLLLIFNVLYLVQLFMEIELTLSGNISNWE